MYLVSDGFELFFVGTCHETADDPWVGRGGSRRRWLGVLDGLACVEKEGRPLELILRRALDLEVELRACLTR